MPIPPGHDIRWNLILVGGGLMDLGCYPIRMLHDILGTDPTVVAAQALTRGDIDRQMTARLRYGDTQATIVSSMWSRHAFAAKVELRTDHARTRIPWPYHPKQGGRLAVDGSGIWFRERADKRPSYDYQFEAFRGAVEHGGPNVTNPAAVTATMRTIDRIYSAAGLRVREPS
nr:oxidoreductase [Cryobacterium lactosi]